MKKTLIILGIICCISSFSFSQTEAPVPYTTINQSPDWQTNFKAQGDSCGAYFNNYIGIHKTSIIRQEYLRVGNASEAGHYKGRAQRFNALQPIEVSGVEFYSYILNNPSVDSLMVITTLNDYDAVNYVGTELARDTVYVKHNSFTTALPNLSVKSFFDQAITVTSDYIVTVFTPTDDSLIILANDPNTNEGNGEGLSYALYDNPSYPSFYGWYDMLVDFSYDYDYLIAPLVKYKQHNGFTLTSDTICENINDACVNYSQQIIFSDLQYNANAGNSTSSIYWVWGDNTFNLGLTSACHMYDNGGNYTISLNDTIDIWDYNTNYCIINLTAPIVVLDSANADFTFNQTNSTVDFVATVSNYDSLWWDFGDGQTESNNLTPQHIYSTISTFDVWLHVINQCSEDSIMYQVTTDNIGITEINDSNFLSIYPNPSSNSITIDIKQTDTAIIKITDINGQTVYFNSNVKNKTSIDISDFSNGLYIVNLINNSTIYSVKLIKD
ncbi:MAG TPA: T9SS type A sorting domain-containing protein [Crocinitomix sp.]|nr:T9SS type A sorting domain-containing protein [Crocinitomix sp.]